MRQLRLVALLGRLWLLLLVVVAVGLAVSATWAAQAVATAHVFAAALAPDPGAGLAGIAPWLVLLVAMVVLRPLLTLLREVTATAVMTRVKLPLRQRLMVRLAGLAVYAPGDGRTGHDQATVVDGVENLDPYLGRYVPQLVTTAVVVTGISAALVAVDPVTGLIVGAAGLLLPMLPRMWDRMLEVRGADHWDAYQDLHAEFVDSMQGMTTLVGYGAAGRRQAELAESSERLLARTLRQLRVSLLESGLNGIALTAVPLLAVAMVWLRRDTLGVVEGFVVVLLAVELVRPFRDLAALWHAGYLGTFSGRRIAALLREPGPPAGGRVVPATTWALVGVDAGYPGSDLPVLRDVHWAVAPGTTAVTGPSGGGKSTVVAVLAGLLAPHAGWVAGPGDQADAISLVPQDPVLLTGTVRENIGGSATSEGLTIEEAAWAAGIGTDDPALGLETEVGERGALLSGGQRQRVAIARAVSQRRSVLVLDEATSALDGRSEQAILQRLRAVLAGRPLIVVGHRPVPGADQVVRVEDGRLSCLPAPVVPAPR